VGTAIDHVAAESKLGYTKVTGIFPNRLIQLEQRVGIVINPALNKLLMRTHSNCQLLVAAHLPLTFSGAVVSDDVECGTMDAHGAHLVFEKCFVRVSARKIACD
jgi:hypothetical protein